MERWIRLVDVNNHHPVEESSIMSRCKSYGVSTLVAQSPSEFTIVTLEIIVSIG